MDSGVSSQIETVSKSIRFQGDSGGMKILITVTTKDFLNDRSLAE